MNIFEGENEEKDIREILVWSWDIFTDRPEIVIPFGLVYVLELVFGGLLGLMTPIQLDLIGILFIVATLNVFILLFLGYLLANGVGYLTAVEAETGSEKSLRARGIRALLRLPALFLASIIALGLVLFGLMIFLLPGVYLATKLALAAPAIVIDGRGPIEGLRSSWTLTRGSFEKVFIFVILAFIGTIIVSLIPIVGTLISVMLIDPILAIGFAYLYLERSHYESP